jgi:hypothetical protein
MALADDTVHSAQYRGDKLRSSGFGGTVYRFGAPGLPRRALRGGIPGPPFEPLGRPWSRFYPKIDF